jgi:hypothetical protein
MGPNGTRFARGHFRAPKSPDFQGQLLLMALELDVSHIKIISSRPIYTTGTLIVNLRTEGIARIKSKGRKIFETFLFFYLSDWKTENVEYASIGEIEGFN